MACKKVNRKLAYIKKGINSRDKTIILPLYKTLILLVNYGTKQKVSIYRLISMKQLKDYFLVNLLVPLITSIFSTCLSYPLSLKCKLSIRYILGDMLTFPSCPHHIPTLHTKTRTNVFMFICCVLLRQVICKNSYFVELAKSS